MMASKLLKTIFIGLGAALFVTIAYALLFTVQIYRLDRVSIGTINYRTNATEAEMASVHAHALHRLQASEFYRDNFRATVILPESYTTFRILSFFQNAGAFGNAFELLGYITIAPAQVSDDKVTTSSPTNNTRSLSGVLAHEFTHLLLYSALGFEKYSTLPTWKMEGYADYIAQESSFPEAQGMALFCSGKADAGPSYLYFRYRKAVGYLLDDAGLTFHEIAAGSMGFSETEKLARQAACHG